MAEHRFDILPLPYDARDDRLQFIFPSDRSHYRSVDLRPLLRLAHPNIEDQGAQGSCGGHGMSHALEILFAQNNLECARDLSRAYAYWAARKIMGTEDEDSGVDMRALCHGAKTYGCCKEDLMPYSDTDFITKPSAAALADGAMRAGIVYSRCYSADAAIVALLRQRPVVGGFLVRESFREISSTGIVPEVSAADAELGGHCMTLCGYDLASNRATLLNSWGAAWGDRGACYVSLDWITQSNLGLYALAVI